MSAENIVDSDQRLTECASKQAGISWPLPVDDAVNEIVDRIRQAGGIAYRKEVAAMAIVSLLHDHSGGEDLAECMLSYRRATIEDL